MENFILIPVESFDYKIKISYSKSVPSSYELGLYNHKLYIEFKNKNINFINNFYDINTGMNIIVFPELSIIPQIKGFRNRTLVNVTLKSRFKFNNGLLYPTDILSKKEIAKLKLLL